MAQKPLTLEEMARMNARLNKPTYRDAVRATNASLHYSPTFGSDLRETYQYALQNGDNLLDVANTIAGGGSMTALKPGDILSFDFDAQKQSEMDRVAANRFFQSVGAFDNTDYAYNKGYVHLTSTDYLKNLLSSLEAANTAWNNGGEEDFLAFTQRNNAVKNKLAEMDAQGRNYYDVSALTEADLLWFDQTINGNERWTPRYAVQEDVDRINALADQWGSVEDWENFDLATHLGIEAPQAYDDSNYKVVSEELNRRSALEAMQASIRGDANYASLSVYTDTYTAPERSLLAGNAYEPYIKGYDDLTRFMNAGASWAEKNTAAEFSLTVRKYLSKGYDYISADELADYNALINAGRLEEAEQYLELLRPELLYRRAMVLQEYQRVKATNPWLAVPTWVEAGLHGIANVFYLPHQIYETATGKDSPWSSAWDSYNKQQWTSEAQIGAIHDADLPDLLDKVATYAYQGVTGFRDNAARIIASGGDPTGALILAGLQSGSGSLHESAERDDMSAAAKIIKAIGTAAIEVGTEKIGLDALFDKGQAGALKYLRNLVLSEMGEETLNVMSEPVLETVVAYLFGHEADIMSGPEFWQNLTDTAITTAISSLLMGGGGAVSQSAGTRSTGKNLRQNGDIEGVLRIAESMPEASESYKSAAPVREALNAGKKVSNSKLGKMVSAVARDIGEQHATTVNSVFEESIQDRLVELGEEPSNAKKLAPALRNMYQGKKLTRAERESLNWTDNATQVFKEMHNDPEDISDGKHAAQESSDGKHAAQAATEGDSPIGKHAAQENGGKHAMQAWMDKAQSRVQEVAYDTLDREKQLNDALSNKSSITTAVGKAKDRAKALKGKNLDIKAIAYDDGTEGGQGSGEFKRVVKRGKDTFVAIAKDGGETVEIPVDKLTSVGDEGLATIIEYAAYDARHEMSAEEVNILAATYARQGGEVGSFIRQFEDSYLSGYSGIESAPSDMAPELQKIAYEHGQQEAAADEAQRVARAQKARKVEKPVFGWLGEVDNDKQITGSGDASALEEAMKGFTDSQRGMVKFGNELGRSAGVNVVYFASKADSKGNLNVQNGSYDPNTHTIYLDINAGANTVKGKEELARQGRLGDAVGRVLGHEVTHVLEATSGEYYAKYKQAVKEALTAKGQDWVSLVREKINNAIANGEKLTYAGAEAEVVADASEYMLQDSKFVKNLDTSLKGKVKAAIRDFIEKVNEAFRRLGLSGHVESRVLRTMQDGVYHYEQRLQDLWDMAFSEMVGQEVAATADGEQETLPVQYSPRAVNDPNKTTIKQQIASVAKTLNAMDAVAAVTAPDISKWPAQKKKEWALETLKASGYKIDVQSFGVVEVGKNQIETSLTYLDEPGELAAFACIPRVLKRGIQLAGHEDHKGRKFETVTFAAPVTINGVRGNMAVVVKKLDRNLYKTHRILMPDGSAFEFSEQQKTEVGLLDGIPQQEAQGQDANSATGIVAQSPDSVNGKIQKSVREEAMPVDELPETRQFSGRTSVEKREDGLMAMHNLKLDDMWGTIRLGGFPMPSIAIVKAKHGHTMYGPYSVIFGRKTIDPEEDSRNRVYGADAWTPVFPTVETELLGDAMYDVQDEVAALAEQVDEEFKHRANTFFGNFSGEDSTRYSMDDLLDKAWGNYGLMGAHLTDKGEKVTIEEMDVEVNRGYNPKRADTYDKMIDIIGLDNLVNMGGRQLIDTYGDQLAAEIRVPFARLNTNWKAGDRQAGLRMIELFGQAIKYEGSGRDTSTQTTKKKDYYATASALEKQIDREDFNAWMTSKIQPFLGQQGIYNGKERFTPMGNRRTFKQTHMPLTAENVVKSMLTQQESNIPATDAHGLMAAAAARYGSVDEIRADSERLGKISDEEYRARLADADNDLRAFLNAIEAWDYDQQEEVGDLLVQAAKGKVTAARIKTLFNRHGYTISAEASKMAANLLDKVRSIPTGYFEAKPARVVTFDEVRMVVAPQDMPADLASKLDELGIPYTTYDGTDADRLEKANAVEGVKFSVRDVDVSYDALTKKPDMKLTMLTNNISGRDRGAIVAAGYRNASSIGRIGVSGMPAVYVKDIGREVHVSKKSLGHGLDRRTDQLSAATQHAGELLQNAILINTATPKLPAANESYILLSAEENPDGTITPVSFVVNSFTNELQTFDVLKSMKQKQNQSRITAGIGANALLPTDSTISIAELIDLVKNDFTDVWSNDVLTTLGLQRKPTEITSSLRYSLRDTVPDTLSIREYLGAMKPTGRMTETEKLLLKKYQENLKTLEEKEKLVAEQEAIMQTATGEELTKARNRRNIYRTQANRAARALMDAERNDGFARLMATSLDAVNRFSIGNTDSVADATDALEKELADLTAQLRKLDADVSRTASGQKAAFARGLFDQKQLNTVAQGLKDAYGSRMSAKAIADRLALAYSEIYADIGAEGAKRFAAAAHDLAEDILRGNKYRYKSEILPTLSEQIGAISLTETDLQEIRNAGLTVREYKAMLSPYVKVVDNGSDLISYASNAEYYGDGALASILGDGTEGDLAMRLYETISAEKTKEADNGYEGKSEGQLTAEIMADIAGSTLPLTDNSATAATLRNELLKYAGESAEAVKAIDAAIEKAKKVTKSAGSVWHAAVKDMNTTRAAAEYYRKLEEQRRLAELQEQKQMLTDQLKGEAGKMLQEARDRYQQQMQDIRNRRDLNIEIGKHQRHIKRVVKRLDDRIRHEEDYKNVKEPLKPAVHALVRTFMDGFGSLVFDSKTADRLRTVYDAIANEDAAPEFYSDDVADMLTELAELAEQDANRRAEGSSAMSAVQEKLDTYTKVAEIADHIYKMVTAADEIFVNGKRESFAAISGEVGGGLVSRKDKALLVGRARDAIRVADDLLRTGNMTPTYFFQHLGNSGLSKLFDGMMNGQTEYAQAIRQGRDAVHEAKNRYNFHSWQHMKDGVEFRTEQGHTIALTTPQMMWVYATAKREATNSLMATRHLDQGGFRYEPKDLPRQKGKMTAIPGSDRLHKLSAADVKKITDTLTAEQKACADELVSYLSNECAEQGNRASMELFGIRKYKESYYFPFKTASDQRYQHSAAGSTSTTNDARVKHTSFTHSLRKGANTPLVMGDFFEVIADHINQMATYSSFVVPIESMNRVLNAKVNEEADGSGNDVTIRSLVGRKHGEPAQKYMADLMKDLNGGPQTDNRGTVSALFRAFKRGAVMGSLSVSLQQPTAIARAFAYVKPKHFAHITMEGNKQTWERMLKYSGSAVIKDMGKFDVGTGKMADDWIANADLQDFKVWQRGKFLLDTQGFNAAKNNWVEWATQLPGVMDRITWTHIWKAIEAEQAEAHPSMDRNSAEFQRIVGQRFDYVINRTQVYDSILSKSQNMRSKNGFAQMSTAFMAEPTLNINMLYDAAVGTHTPGERAGIVTSVAASSILAAAMASLIAAWNKDDDDRKWQEKYLAEFASRAVDSVNPLTMIPYVADVWNMVNGYDIERTDLSVMKDVIDYASTFVSKAKDPDKASTWRDYENLFGTIANLTGIPAKNISRDIRRVRNLLATDKSASSGAALKYTLLESITPMGLYEDSSKAYCQRLVAAVAEGDTQEAYDLWDYLTNSKKPSQDSINTNIRNELKRRVQEGTITTTQATEILRKYAPYKDDKNNISKPQEWLGE